LQLHVIGSAYIFLFLDIVIKEIMIDSIFLQESSKFKAIVVGTIKTMSNKGIKKFLKGINIY
jgi:hypothetical protein